MNHAVNIGQLLLDVVFPVYLILLGVQTIVDLVVLPLLAPEVFETGPRILGHVINLLLSILLHDLRLLLLKSYRFRLPLYQ